MTYVESLGEKSKAAAAKLSMLTSGKKNEALLKVSEALIANSKFIIDENKKDLAEGEKNGLTKALLDRLMLDEKRISSIADAVLKIVSLDDPVGIINHGFTAPNGLVILQKRVPLGCIGIIYEARPNVTVDAFALCLKSGNSVILRGGKEAFNSNMAIVGVLQKTLESVGITRDAVLLIENTSRETATELMRLNGYLDVLIPRGGKGLIQSVVKNSTVPVIETGAGNCHVYVDSTADIDMAVSITNNAKTSRPSVCNAIETLLVHEDIAQQFLPKLKIALESSQCEIRGCGKTLEILGDSAIPATDEDYETEFLDYILAVKVVGNIDEAIAHIRKYTSGHSECIVTSNLKSAQKFTDSIDASAVYVNASTRFTDGGEFGLGAEIGISTQKLHVRGPMGLSHLTTIKYVITGDGQIR